MLSAPARRPSTRRTFVSTQAAGAPNANDATIAAVNGPMPSMRCSSPAARGQPDAAICLAARCSRTARWLYPMPAQARITSAGDAAASASTVGNAARKRS